MGIFSQLRDRRLFQIVASYLAAGWIGLEVVDQFVDRGVVAEVVYDLTLIGYLCGIPAAFLVGWYHGEKGNQNAPRSELAMLALLGVLFLGLSSFTLADYRTDRMAIEAAQREAGLDLRRMAVLYFEDYTAGAEYRHVADGFTEALIDELSRVSGLQVASRNAAAHFRDTDLSRDSIARTLDVGTVVDGSVETRGDKLRVTVRLFEGHSGNEFRSTSVEVSPEELLLARDRVIEDVANLLRQWLGEEVRVRAGGHRITNAEAWTLYQRAERERKDADALARQHDLTGAFARLARADSLLALASTLAPDWPDPPVLLATTAYRRSRLVHDRHQLFTWVERGLEHARAALDIAPQHARALELRGTLKYWKSLNLQGRSPEEAGQLVAAARRDLEEAVRIDATLAGAYSTLSHLLFTADLSAALMAGWRAYEADAYLEAAPDVLLRLTLGSYDIENFDQMQRWCDEGARRFPQNFRFTDCQLLLMTTRQVEPDIDLAWGLAARLDSLSPSHRRAYDRARGLALVGGVIARAAGVAPQPAVIADSARAVLARALEAMTHQADPQQELLPLTAYMYTLVGDDATAIELLRRYVAVNPGSSFEHSWRWRELRGKPEFRPLLAKHP